MGSRAFTQPTRGGNACQWDKGRIHKHQVAGSDDLMLERRTTPRTSRLQRVRGMDYLDDASTTFCAPAATQPVPPSAQTTR
jgi:hypothetical protein